MSLPCILKHFQDIVPRYISFFSSHNYFYFVLFSAYFMYLLSYVRYSRAPSVLPLSQISSKISHSPPVVSHRIEYNEGNAAWAFPVESQARRRLREAWERVSKDLVMHHNMYVDFSTVFLHKQRYQPVWLTISSRFLILYELCVNVPETLS